MSRYLFAHGAFMSEGSELPRLQLGNLWPEDASDVDRARARRLAAHKAQQNLSERPRCLYCAGQLVRSRVRIYERALTLVSKRRPYRCLDCRSRRWL